jgi:Domain of Unknown Function (DUF1259)
MIKAIRGLNAKPGRSFPTPGQPPLHGVTIEKDMGVNTWAAFAGTDDNAIVDGDFAVTEDQLQPVLKELLEDKINIVAIHQHMAHEEPRIMFFHYWEWSGQRFGECRQRRAFGWWLAQGQFAASRLNAAFCALLPRKGQK